MQTIDGVGALGIRMLTTTRTGGVSKAPYHALNLAEHVGDTPADVAGNRRRLVSDLALPSEPAWLEQVHGTRVVELHGEPPTQPADAVVTRVRGVVLAIMTADCLPVLLCARDGAVIGAAHAGWRGLAAGVIEATLEAMQVPAGEIIAWLGPAIGAKHYEVGDEVRAAFAESPDGANAFSPSVRPNHWQCDLVALARARLAAAGVRDIAGGHWDTFAEAERFYSFRRDGDTGRMASLIWMQAAKNAI